MRTFLGFLFITVLFFSCNSKQGNPARFKQGTFEIPSGEGYGKTIIKRIDSLQIEEYTKETSVLKDSITKMEKIKHIDTLFIKWKNNFAYTLRMKNPKTKLDKDPIFVQITEVSDTSYSFTAKIGYSNFKQKGTVFISKKQ